MKLSPLEIYIYFFSLAVKVNSILSKATNLYCRVLAGCFVLGEGGVILDGKIKGKSRKIPKISPGAYIFQRPLLRGLLLEGLMFGGAYLLREIFVYKSIRLAS